MRNQNIGTALLIIFLFFIPSESKACTLKIPAQSIFNILSTGHCRFSPMRRNNYFDLSYYKATAQGFDELVAEGTDIARSDDGLYLPMEFFQDANYGVEQLSPRALKGSSSYPIRLESTSLIYVMSMPKKQFTGAQKFSLKLKCLEAAGGDEKSSFTTRYCVPLSNKADGKLLAYRNFVARVTIQKDL